MQTIRTFSDLFQAQSAKAMLESEGIAVFLKNEHIAAVNPFYVHLSGGIELQVAAEDAACAYEIIGREPECRDEVEQIASGIARIFWRSIGFGLIVGVAYIAFHGVDDLRLMDAAGFVLLGVVGAMIIFSVFFSEKDASSADDDPFSEK